MFIEAKALEMVQVRASNKQWSRILLASAREFEWMYVGG
jgi:hypothetical protein